jgi:hypothetical protein
MLCYSLFEKSQQEWLLCQVGFSQQGTLYPENGVLCNSTLTEKIVAKWNKTKKNKVFHPKYIQCTHWPKNSTYFCLFVLRVRGGGMPVAWSTCQYLQRSPMVVAPLHKLPCGRLLRGARPLLQYYTGMKQDCSTSLTLPQANRIGKEHLGG